MRQACSLTYHLFFLLISCFRTWHLSVEGVVVIQGFGHICGHYFSSIKQKGFPSYTQMKHNSSKNCWTIFRLWRFVYLFDSEFVTFSVLILHLWFLLIFTPTGGFHPKDIERVKSTNIWLQRFLEQHDLDHKAAFDMLWDTCIWRKTFGANGQ